MKMMFGWSHARGGTAPLLVALLAAATLLAAVAPASAAAQGADGPRHELELARSLAFDFQLFDLAYDVLEEAETRLKRMDLGDDAEKAALKPVALMRLQIAEEQVRWAQFQLRDASPRDRELWEERVKEAQRKLEEANAAAEATATTELGKLLIKMGRAKSAVDRGESHEARGEADQAAEQFALALQVFIDCRTRYKDIVDDLKPRLWQGALSEEDTGRLRQAWYFYTETLYFLARLGDEPERNLELLLSEISEFSFEFEDTDIFYYGQALRGDAFVLAEQYSQAASAYSVVLDLELGPEVPAALRKQMENLQLLTFNKYMEAQVAADNYDNVISAFAELKKRFSEQSTTVQYKLCDLLRVEAEIKINLDGEADPARRADVVRRLLDELERYAQDPDGAFRQRYYRTLARIGRQPGLDADTRLRCGAAALESNDSIAGIKIYLELIGSLRVQRPDGSLDREATQRMFEMYGPEAYWQLAQSYVRQVRFMEAGLTYFRAANLFAYFAVDERFKGEGPLPDHMTVPLRDNPDRRIPRFERLADREKVRTFPLELAKSARAAMVLWSPAGSDPNFEGNAVDGTVEERWRRDIEDFESRVARLIADPQERQKNIYGDAWREWRDQVGAGVNADFHHAVAMFLRVAPAAGRERFFNAAEAMGRMMDVEADRKFEAGLRTATTPYPENDRGIDGDALRGVEVYEAERARIGSELLIRLPQRHQRVLTDTLDAIINWNRNDDVRLLYWHKARYFALRMFYIVVERDYDALVTRFPDVWDLSLGTILRRWVTMESDRLSDREPSEVADELSQVRLLARRVFDYGNLMRTNPWSGDRERGLFPRSVESERTARLYQSAAVDLWADFKDAFEFAFLDVEDGRHEDYWRQMISSVLILGFKLYMDLNQPADAERILDQFDRAFPADTRSSTLQAWRDSFIKRLKRSYQNANEFERKVFTRALGGVREPFAALKSDRRGLTVEEIRISIEDAALYCWIERPGGNIVCPTEEDLRFEYIAEHLVRTQELSFRTERGALDITAMMQFVNDNPNSVDGLLGAGTDISIGALRAARDGNPAEFWAALAGSTGVVHTDRADLLDLLPDPESRTGQIQLMGWVEFGADVQKRIADLGRRNDFAAVRDLVTYYNNPMDVAGAEKLAREIIAGLASGEYTDTSFHPTVSQMHAGYQARILANRDQIADQLFEVWNRYTEQLVRLESKYLTYVYEELIISGEELNNDQRRRFGGLFFFAEQWQRTIEFIQPLFDSEYAGEAQPVNHTRRDQVEEVTLRWYLGRSHYMLAKLTGEYTTTDEDWREAQRHYDRLLDFVKVRNQRAAQKPVFSSSLDRIYFFLLKDLTELYESRGAFLEARNNDDDAAEAYSNAAYVYGLQASQAANGSPDERVARAGQLSMNLAEARLNRGADSDQKLRSLVDYFRTFWAGRDPEQVWNGTPEVKAKYLKIYNEAMSLARQRGLIQ
jgi:hypothetical protein